MATQSRTGTPRPPAVWLDRRTPPHVVTLVLMTGLSALNMNMVLPSLPSLAAHYHADYGVASLTVSAYLGLTAVLQLVLGPLSDRYGRRPVTLGCFAVFLLATLGCAFAPTIEWFLAFRMAQATVASAFALSRAIVRDMVGTDEAASLIGYITMGMSLSPMIAPVIGGFVDEAFGWRAVFGLTFAVGVAVTALIWADQGETNTTPSESLTAQFRAYPELLRSPRFWGYTATASFASGTFFAFLGGGPLVATEFLHMGPAEVGAYFGVIALGYLLGNYLSGRFAAQVGLNRMMLSGSLVATAGMALALGLFALGLQSATTFFGTIGLVGVGNGLLLPSANAGIVSVRPHLAGSASGLGGALMIGGGAALSVLAGAMLGPGTGAWPLLWLMFVCSVVSIGTTLWVMQVARRRAAEAAGR
ncbi:multidrug effflux MFS transporter [Amaricoccus sp.]|uniref:multidrug effflux MFS transporter n=1 Tax=Amaricoccus sp. TaxID=1872485 RepID=UPI001B79101E|nr:multidrug effflux MFS transporter [Amaricoccus sp.]MBP7240876.1 multidrug effflux MFS transporter [Amaricoccus sp.]